MKWILSLLALSLTVFAGPTYTSMTRFEDSNGVSGFRNQFMNVPDIQQSAQGDIAIGASYTVPYNTKLLTQTEEEARSLALSAVDWCIDDMLRVKVYIPAHIASFQVALQYLPINDGLMFATYIPDGEIREDKDGIVYTNLFEELWANHKTTAWIFKTAASFVLNSTYISRYGIDTSKGGYLYLSFSQSDNKVSNKEYDPRYKMSFSIYYTFQRPLTSAMREDILSQIPTNETEPVEPDQILTTGACSQYAVSGNNVNFTPAPFLIEVEAGEPLSPQEACEKLYGNDAFYDADKTLADTAECYDTRSDQYQCLVEGLRWDGRCISADEEACNADPDTTWFLDGNTCLDDLKSIEPVIDEEENALYFEPFQVNEDGWMTQMFIHNKDANETRDYTIAVKPRESNSLGFTFNAQPGDSATLEVTKSNNKIRVNLYDSDGVAMENEQTIPTADTNGSISLSVDTNDSTWRDAAKTEVIFKYGNNIQTAAAVSSSSSSSSSAASSSGDAQSSVASLIYQPVSSVSSAYSSSAVSQNDDGGDNVIITVPVSSSSTAAASSAATSSVQSSASSSAPKVYTSVSERLTDEDGEFSISGWIYAHDFVDEENASFDQLFASTVNGKAYRLRPSSGEELLWEQVTGVQLDEADKLYAFVYVGDWDHDQTWTHDWVAVELASNKVFSFAGNTGLGDIKYGEVLPVDAVISGDTITFSAQ